MTNIDKKERPILFSTEMVKAILNGHKTMTRRVVDFTRCKPFINHDAWPYVKKLDDGTWMWSDAPDFHYPTSYMKDGVKCPYGQVGDRLWVRETFKPFPFSGCDIIYKADNVQWGELGIANWKPSIFMPRKSSRITLEIINIRVERLQDITQDDALAEGMTRELATHLGISVTPSEEEFNLTKARRVFIDLWDSINLKRGYSWKSNPWVWAIEFKRVDK